VFPFKKLNADAMKEQLTDFLVLIETLGFGELNE
jgi:hypothetical protein